MIFNNNYCLPFTIVYLYPSEGCFSDVRGPFGTKNPKNILQNTSYENCSHFWNIFSKNLKTCRKLLLDYVPIYNQIHRIRIRYSKYQFIIENTPKIPKHFRTTPCFRIFSKNKSKPSKTNLNLIVIYIIFLIHILYILENL